MENEYGSYSTCDKAYMTGLYDMGVTHLGNNTILFTADGYTENYLKCGSLDPRYLVTIDFGPCERDAETMTKLCTHYDSAVINVFVIANFLAPEWFCRSIDGQIQGHDLNLKSCA